MRGSVRAVQEEKLCADDYDLDISFDSVDRPMQPTVTATLAVFDDGGAAPTSLDDP